MSEDNDELRLFETISRLIGTSLRAGGCSNMHFAFIVWCNCEDGPLCAFTDDNDNHRVRFMLDDAGEKLSLTMPTVNMEGHA